MRRCAAAVAACLPLLAHGAWSAGDYRLNAARRDAHAVEHFGAQLVLTPDETHFLKAWRVSSSPLELPSTATVRRGSSVTAMFVFQGCARDETGRCDVVADLALEGPDGGYIPAGSMSLWSAASFPGRLHLGNGSMQVSFDLNDRTGQYKVIATVRDRVSGQSLVLRSGLQVLE
ncbi:hypothetical protein [Aromatoleum petrolei]|uniref:Uncharacterized protein n=1 Tax=Aromatoleum petrolei TaxID=76116 RepID=A0ABX1MS12_9RHOO|nr:hypothetical protein [Aromatoleum petrolei]NMF89111.1 hypothetical protein [Aromatoleum petrolei]QTQ38296.1 Uncharacterized protein ToN1_41930 [Aromatoleum petrolei]